MSFEGPPPPPPPPPKVLARTKKNKQTPSEKKKTVKVDLTLTTPFSVYENNPAQFEKTLIKEISGALNIDESYIRFIDARRG